MRVADDDRRRRQTPESKTILAPTLGLGGPVINYQNVQTIADSSSSVNREAAVVEVVAAAVVVVVDMATASPFPVSAVTSWSGMSFGRR